MGPRPEVSSVLPPAERGLPRRLDSNQRQAAKGMQCRVLDEVTGGGDVCFSSALSLSLAPEEIGGPRERPVRQEMRARCGQPVRGT